MTAANGEAALASSRIAQTVVGMLAYTGLLAAVLVPMGVGLADLRGDLARVESAAAKSREDNKQELRTYMDAIEERFDAKVDSHLDFAEKKSGEIDSEIAQLRERVRALESKMSGMNTQIEVQHRWLRDSMRSLKALLERYARAYWDGTKIVWPEVDEVILEGIGEATINGNGHK